MTGHGEKLTRKQDQAIVGLLLCPSIREAARQSGVAEVTLYRWLKLEAFQTAYREARRLCVHQALGKVQQASGDAVETLRTLMQDPTTPTSARVSAAKAILDTAIKAVEVEDLEQRLLALEVEIRGHRDASLAHQA